MLAISNGKVILPDGEKSGHIIVDGCQIKRILSPDESPPEGAEMIDASGCFVLPGLIELHVQGAGGYSLLDPHPDSVQNVRDSLASFGTTTFLATTVFDTTLERQVHIDRILDTASEVKGGAGIAGIHLEGPFINLKKQGVIQDRYIADYSEQLWERVKESCGDLLKMMTVAPEVTGGIRVLEDMSAKGMIAALGHTNATFDEANAGMDAGINHVTHVANAMRSLHHREPGALGAVLMNENLTMQVITDGNHLHPEFVRWLVDIKGSENMCIITDGMGAMGRPPGWYEYGGLRYQIQNGAAYYEDGTLIGTALTQLQLIGRAMEFTGLPLHEVVNMASLYPARVIGVDDRKGSLEVGKDSDILICDRDLNVKDVIVRGEILTRI